MDKWIKKLSGAVIASVLALTLSSKAYANAPEAVLDEEPAQIIEENNSAPKEDVKKDSKNVVKEDSKDVVKEDSKDVVKEDSKDVVKEDSKDVVKEDSKDVVNQDSEDVVKEDSKDVVNEDSKDVVNQDSKDVVNQDSEEVVKGDSKKAVGLADIKSTRSLPDAIAEGSLRNAPEENTPDEAVNITVNSADPVTLDGNQDGSDDGSQTINSIESTGAFNINITASGLNTIGIIKSQEGDVRITGTGIVLIDTCSFGEGHGFILSPIDGSDETTVPAVFRKITDTDHDYELLNGLTNPGILTGQYVIPDGINLIMPSGTSIELTSPETSLEDKYTKIFDDVSTELNPIYGQENIITSCLTIPEDSTLTISNGATVNLTAKVLKKGEVGKEEAYEDYYVQTPVLDVRGNLHGAGEITGNGGILVLSGKNLKNTVNHIPRLNANVSISPDIFKIYDEDGVIWFNRMYFELSRYVSSRDLSSNDKSIIYQPPYDPSEDIFGYKITAHFGYAIENEKPEKPWEKEYWPEGDCISCKD